MDSHKLTITDYDKKSWSEEYPDHQVKINELYIDPSWKEFIDNPIVQENMKEINRYLSHCLKTTNGSVEIFPYPELVFNAFNATPFNKINVVFLGQDPYHQLKQAMGLSFSIPKGVAIPSSLKNIYDNLVNFGHLKEKPKHGNLAFWAYQGCLMLNTSLTVQESSPNSHESYWKDITDFLIKFISEKTENVVFVLWGGFAAKKVNLIDQTKHKVLISSHPSGFSYTNKLGIHESFAKSDHFKEINEYLVSHGKNSILWDIL